MEKKIRYTARDFEAVKKELIDFSKKYYPEFFKTELANPTKDVKHYVTKNV